MKFSLLFAALILSIPCQAAVSNWEPFEMRHGHITLPIKINGIESRLMLDTGANINSVSATFVAEHGGSLTSGGTMNVKGVYGTEKRRMYNNINLEMWGSTFNMDNMVALNMPGDIGLLLGTGFFEQFIVQIDYPNQKLRLLTRDSVDMRKLRNLKTKKISNMLSVKVNLNGEKNLWLLLDTGASFGVVTKRMFAEEYGWLEEFTSEELIGAGANRTQVMSSFQMPFIELGPFTIEAVPTAVPAEGQATTFGRPDATGTGSNIRGNKSSGIIGYEVLKHFVATIDYKRGYVHLEAP